MLLNRLSPLSQTNHNLAGSFTSLHQDGNGTVDSGHTALEGHNEVFILPRTEEESEKIRVVDVLLGGAGDPQSKNAIQALYKLPHDEEGNLLTFEWPTVAMVQKLKDLGYVVEIEVL